MARRGNYGSEKRQKEIRRKQKAESKMERRRARRERTGEGGQTDERGPSPAPDGPAGGEPTTVS